MKYTPIGVDIAKHLIQIHFIDEHSGEVIDNKNDLMGSRTIWMALQQPGKTIAVKRQEQQAVLALHRMRRQLVKFRTKSK